MNIEELYSLAQWLKKQVPNAQTKYQAVHKILQHNASQPNKQPLEEPLTQLLTYLPKVPINLLSNEQIRLLDAFGVAGYLGQDGAIFVNASIKKSDFDPATAVTDFQGAIDGFVSANQRADNLIQAFNEIDMPLATAEIDEDRVLIRVEFRSEAAINNVVDWKKWSANWHDIARGLSLAVDQSPDEVHVAGATRGSIILELAGTYIFVRLLTGIVKSVTSIAKDVMQLRLSVEDLRSKKLLNEKIEKEINEEVENRKKNGVDVILEEIKDLLPNKTNGEQDNALKKAIGQLLDFHEKGGEVDFVAPEEPEYSEEDETEDEDTLALISELRESIEDLRVEKEIIKSLTHFGGEEDD